MLGNSESWIIPPICLMKVLIKNKSLLDTVLINKSKILPASSKYSNIFSYKLNTKYLYFFLLYFLLIFCSASDGEYNSYFIPRI